MSAAAAARAAFAQAVHDDVVEQGRREAAGAPRRREAGDVRAALLEMLDGHWRVAQGVVERVARELGVKDEREVWSAECALVALGKIEVWHESRTGKPMLRRVG